jgi:hypothetical protein
MERGGAGRAGPIDWAGWGGHQPTRLPACWPPVCAEAAVGQGQLWFHPGRVRPPSAGRCGHPGGGPFLPGCRIDRGVRGDAIPPTFLTHPWRSPRHPYSPPPPPLTLPRLPDGLQRPRPARAQRAFRAWAARCRLLGWPSDKRDKVKARWAPLAAPGAILPVSPATRPLQGFRVLGFLQP